VFTNKIAGVLHSICNAYGGNANKNIGDAFLMSWIINENPKDDLDILSIDSEFSFCDETKASKGDPTLADRALLSVVKIYMALQHDKYFLDTLSEKAQRSLVEKLEDRPGPVVQLGCGLHYGTAVQGAIGSPRKIDPTYISKDVDFSETLESSTKKYGVKVLVSGAFHGLLLPSSRRRCRKIDRVMVYKEDGKEAKEEIIDLYTYDMDIDNLFFKPEDEVAHKLVGESYGVIGRTFSTAASTDTFDTTMRYRGTKKPVSDLPYSENYIKKRSFGQKGSWDNLSARNLMVNSDPAVPSPDNLHPPQHSLILPTGSVPFRNSDWLSSDMMKLRSKYIDGDVFREYNKGLNYFYDGSWTDAEPYFRSLATKYDDGPSKYFLRRIEECGGVPPANFLPYNTE